MIWCGIGGKEVVCSCSSGVGVFANEGDVSANCF